MEKIMQAQTLSDSSKQAYMRGKRVLEINPRHPIIKELRDKVAQDSEVIKTPSKCFADLQTMSGKPWGLTCLQ